MSWNLVNNNSNLDLYCNTLHCTKTQTKTDTDGIVQIGTVFYSGSSSADYTQQRGSIWFNYQVQNNYMYIFMSSSTGIWNIVPNPSGTGWVVLKWGVWNSPSPEPTGIPVPYRVRSGDNTYDCVVISDSPTNTYNALRAKVRTPPGGLMYIEFYNTTPITQFNNNQSFSFDNFCIVLPVEKL